MRWTLLIATAALALGCAERNYRLTGRMPPPAITERCNEYAAAVEAKSDEASDTKKSGAEPAGDPIAEEAPAQYGLDARNQDSDRARNAYGDCLARNGY
jgi:hypothetical protein